MNNASLNQLCEKGQSELTATQYLTAAATFAQAENLAWEARDFDTLSRLYLPLQEARRQIRQRCGEGAVCLGQLATTISHSFDFFPQQGFLLRAGLQSLSESVAARRQALNDNLYLEVFLAAVVSDESGQPLVLIAPTADTPLPASTPGSKTLGQQAAENHCLLIHPDDLPPDAPHGTAESFMQIMALWEQLHTPFLTAAEQEPDPIQRMQAFRKTLQVDPACELAHQHLADTARSLRSSNRPR